MAKVEITNGSGTEAKVTADQHLMVSASTFPAFGTQRIRPFREYFTNSAGSDDMGIDGSVTNQRFEVGSNRSDDRYITSVSVAVGYGTTGQAFQWADGTALTNGILLEYESSEGSVTIHDGIKRNEDMFRLSFERVNADWEIRGLGANNDFGYIVNINLQKIVPPIGIQLEGASSQKLVFTVRDNVGASADTFNAIAYGFERYK